jgi:hypothetical protein
MSTSPANVLGAGALADLIVVGATSIAAASEAGKIGAAPKTRVLMDFQI